MQVQYEEITNKLEPLFDIQGTEHLDILQTEQQQQQQTSSTLLINMKEYSSNSTKPNSTFNHDERKKCLKIDIRIYSRIGRRSGFIYQQSNVQFSKKNQIGKMRKIELMIPTNSLIERIIIEIEVENNVNSLFGLQKDESKVEKPKKFLEFQNCELQQNLHGIQEKKGLFFYLLPIDEKKGRNLGPKHRLRFCFYIYNCWYFSYIDYIYLAGHKHESGKKKKESRSLVHNCFQLFIDTEFRSIRQELVDLNM